VERECLD